MPSGNTVLSLGRTAHLYYDDGLNLYAYCHNNPISYVDPTGHEAKAAAEKNFIEKGVDAANKYIDKGTDAMLHQAYESGTSSNKVLGGSFKDVDASRGADEVGHHLPQNAYNVNELGITRNEGPALLMTKEDHALTRTYRGRGKQTMISDKGLNARQRMVLDIINIRENFGTKYNEGLLDAIKYAKTLPQFQK